MASNIAARACIFAALACGAARADIVKSGPAGFEVAYRHEVSATPAQVYDAFAQLPKWWNGQHSWSGSAANMSLDLQAGGCWCERWNGRSVMHGQVVALMPGTMIRFQAALGPLQDRAVNGVLSFVTSAQDGVTRLRVTYRVSGHADAELEQMAGPVDKVIGEQVRRLMAFIATGKPD